MSAHFADLVTRAPVLPPSNMQAEQRLLAALLAGVFPRELASYVQPRHFADPLHGKIFERAMNAVTWPGPVDPLAVHHHFNRTRELEEIGGTAYLTQLADMGPLTMGEGGMAAQDVYEAWARRCLMDLSDGLRSTAAFVTDHAFEPPEKHGPEQQAEALVTALREHLRNAEALLAEIAS